MARTTVKATYSLNQETLRTIERLARQLDVPKSEVLRRAVQQLARTDLTPGDSELTALDQLQHKLKLTEQDALAWESAVRSERHASQRR